MLEQNPETIFCIFCQKQEDTEDPAAEDLYEQGTFAKLVKVINMPNEEHQKTVIVQGLGRCKLKSIVESHPYHMADVESQPELWPSEKFGLRADVQDPDQDLLRGVNQIHQA